MDGAERFFASPHAPSPLLAGLLWSALFLPLLPLTLLVFPSPKWPVRTQPRLTVAALLATPIAAFGAALWRTGSVSAGVAAAAPVHPAMFTIIPASMAHTLLTARGPAQAQSRWVAWGASRSPEVTSPGAG